MASVPFSPIRMIDPLPNCLSIWDSAMSSALSRSLLIVFSLLLRWISGGVFGPTVSVPDVCRSPYGGGVTEWRPE